MPFNLPGIHDGIGVTLRDTLSIPWWTLVLGI